MSFDEVNTHLSGMISGVHTTYDVGVPGAGRMAADMVLKTDGGPVRLVEALRTGRPLLLDLAGRDDLVAEATGWADRRYGSVDRLVGGGPEVAVQELGVGRVHGALGEQDADEALGRVGVGGGAQAAVPAELAG
ncbi:hypothetical protein SAMN05444920_13485 [Nonomuraea solani]|uniref:Uncharacterized protein n=1 Tax=Nonomuraea solani TaxID=1144553 RepID=A0A1H6F1Q1_9ACTN|nr:hypothetical protein SAMN05444920_13485 [Nonomuraea solani]